MQTTHFLIAALAASFLSSSVLADDEFELKLMDQRFAMYRAGQVDQGLWRTDKGSWLRLPVAKLDPAAWHHILISWDLRDEGRLWLTINGVGVTASLGRDVDALPPNPGKTCAM